MTKCGPLTGSARMKPFRTFQATQKPRDHIKPATA